MAGDDAKLQRDCKNITIKIKEKGLDTLIFNNFNDKKNIEQYKQKIAEINQYITEISRLIGILEQKIKPSSELVKSKPKYKLLHDEKLKELDLLQRVQQEETKTLFSLLPMPDRLKEGQTTISNLLNKDTVSNYIKEAEKQDPFNRLKDLREEEPKLSDLFKNDIKTSDFIQFSKKRY